MEEPENRVPEQQNEGAPPQAVGEVELKATSDAPEAEEESKPGLIGMFRESFRRSWQAQRPTSKNSSRKELGKDRSKSLLVLGGFVGVMFLMFVFVFSVPERRKPLNQATSATPDLGRRETPGQIVQQNNVTPLLDVTTANEAETHKDLASPQDVARTASPLRQQAGPAAGSAGTLGDISFSDRALDEQYAMHGTNPPPVDGHAELAAASEDDLKKPSLVFVRAQASGGPGVSAHRAVEAQPTLAIDALPVGTRLVARLQAPVSTAVAAPVVAVIEYNYEQDGQIILPAGSKVTGKLQNATRQGYVSLHFDRLQLPDGIAQKLDAGAMGLDYRPLKGYVTGRNRGLRFLVQSLTGVGEVAAYMVGGSPSNTSVFSEDALLREQMANNVAIAGQNQFNELAFSRQVVVTVPGNTRFYLVLEQGTTPASAPSRFHPVSNPPAMNLTQGQEAEELMELKRELAALEDQANAPGAQLDGHGQP